MFRKDIAMLLYVGREDDEGKQIGRVMMGRMGREEVWKRKKGRKEGRKEGEMKGGEREDEEGKEKVRGIM